MREEYHSLLRSQLEQLLGEAPPPEDWRPLLAAVDEAYRRSDADRTRAQEYLDTVEAVIVALDAEGRVTAINRKGCRVLGYEEKEILGRSWFSTCLPQPEGMERTYPIFLKLMAGELAQAEYFENPVVSRSGEQRQIAWHNALLRNEQGQIIGTLSAGHDITERVRAEAERRDLAAAVEQTQEGVAIFDMDMRMQYVNPAFETLTGYAHQDLLGRAPESLPFSGPLQQFFRNLREAAPKGQVRSGRISHRHPSGLLQVLNATVSSMHGDDGQAGGIVIVLHDMTREVRLEDQLRQSQKMEAMGRLAGGIAHDFNNLLTAILGYAEVTLKRLPPTSALREDVEQIREAAERAAALTGQMLAFSRKQVLNLQSVDLNRLISGMARLLTRTLGQAAELTTDLAPDLPPIHADPVQMQQVIMNLALNARDAMPAGGRLIISTFEADITALPVEVSRELPTGGLVCLTITDTGRGMDETTKVHLFEPFFTTKDAGKGTGFGLAMVYGIIKQSGGHVVVRSEAGRGTTFEIYMPRAAADAVTPSREAPTQAGAADRGVILLAEDELSVRRLTARILREAGYKVREAADGATALEMARSGGDSLNLVVTDIVMPRMNGLELAETLRQERPELPVLMISGHPNTSPSGALKIPNEDSFLRKPFTGAQLLQKVRALLQGGVSR